MATSPSLFICLRLAAGSLQIPAKLEAPAAWGRAGPHLVHALSPVKALLSVFQSSQFLTSLEAAKMRGPLPFLVSLQMGVSFNVGSKDSIYIPQTRAFL